MPSILIYILAKYWKPILITTVCIVLCTGAYVKGRTDTNKKWEHKINQEIANRLEKAQQERDRTDVVRRKIEEARKTRPVDDKRDSCLLSGDPYEAGCI